jgi:uncharacterized membrane protein (DUF2068 family)
MDTPHTFPAQRSTMLRLIAVFKFSKAALLVTVGLGALELLQPEVAARAQRWVDALAATSDRRLIQRLLSWASGVDPRGLQLVALGALLYATLFTIEGTGLWLGKRWAEYLTVIASLMFVPFEITRLVRHATPSLFAALTLNLVIAGYLLWRLRETPPAVRAAATGPET